MLYLAKEVWAVLPEKDKAFPERKPSSSTVEEEPKRLEADSEGKGEEEKSSSAPSTFTESLLSYSFVTSEPAPKKTFSRIVNEYAAVIRRWIPRGYINMTWFLAGHISTCMHGFAMSGNNNSGLIGVERISLLQSCFFLMLFNRNFREWLRTQKSHILMTRTEEISGHESRIIGQSIESRVP